MFDLVLFLVVYFIYLGYADIINKLYRKKDERHNFVLERIEELSKKRNKTVEEQLEYINLRKSIIKGININYTIFIKLFLLILLFRIIPNKLIVYGLLFIWVILGRLLGFKKKRTNYFYDITLDVVSLCIMMSLFALTSVYNIFLILILLVIPSFIFNLTLKRIDLK